MATLQEHIEELEGDGDVRFARLLTICEEHFGAPRINGSHHIFKTPWQGNPRINLQKAKGGKAKSYQVDQVLDALRTLESQQEA